MLIRWRPAGTKGDDLASGADEAQTALLALEPPPRPVDQAVVSRTEQHQIGEARRSALAGVLHVMGPQVARAATARVLAGAVTREERPLLGRRGQTVADGDRDRQAVTFEHRRHPRLAEELAGQAGIDMTPVAEVSAALVDVQDGREPLRHGAVEVGRPAEVGVGHVTERLGVGERCRLRSRIFEIDGAGRVDRRREAGAVIRREPTPQAEHAVLVDPPVE